MKGLDKYRVVAVHAMTRERSEEPGMHSLGGLRAEERFLSLARDVLRDESMATIVADGTANGNTDFVIDAYVIPRSVMAQILKGMA